MVFSAEARYQRDYDSLPDDCRRCRHLNGANKCGYEEETGRDCDCWQNDSVKCKDCVYGKLDNENAEVYCEYYGEFADIKQCEHYDEGDDCK